MWTGSRSTSLADPRQIKPEVNGAGAKGHGRELQSNSLFVLRERRSPLRINGMRGFLRVNRFFELFNDRNLAFLRLGNGKRGIGPIRVKYYDEVSGCKSALYFPILRRDICPLHNVIILASLVFPRFVPLNLFFHFEICILSFVSIFPLLNSYFMLPQWWKIRIQKWEVAIRERRRRRSTVVVPSRLSQVQTSRHRLFDGG